jgi:Holliday junction DNA helicase RuvA
MIDSLTGDVVRIGADHVVIDNGGIAFHIDAPANTLRACHEGHSALLFIHLTIRDDTIQLYGFSSASERTLFRQLLTVGQVGPKLALQILSALPPDALIEAISNRSIERLTAVKGVGRKTAERILVDLRDKIGTANDIGISGVFLTEKEETALRALTSKALGFSVREARQALERLRNEDLTAEELVRQALEFLGSAR